jgi:tetratricopeptide (TPR) repeat protein
MRTGARFPRLEIQLAKASVWFDRQNAERHYYLGTKRSKTGNVADKQAALSDFQAALALSPHNFNSLGGIALILEEAGETDVALRAIEEAALRSASTLGYVDMACEMAFRAKKYDVALVYGRKALAGAPDRALFHRRLANIHIVESREKLARLRLTMAEDLENQGA